MTRGLKTVALSVGAIVLVALAAPRVFQPSTLRLAQAIRELGPIAGWRCTQSAIYAYDPRKERADSTLLAEAPEAILPDVEVERVEASLRGGDTVIWTHVISDNAATGERRVYVLTPGRLQTISVESANPSGTALCNAHLADWHIIAEHGLPNS